MMTAPSTSDRSLVSALLARLDAELAAHPGGVIATDADGTLWEGDVGEELFEALLFEARPGAGGVRAEAHEALVEEARAFGVAIPAGGYPTAIARALYDAHRGGTYPADRAFAMMAWAFAGYRRDGVRATAEWVLDRRRFEAKLRPALGSVLQWARAKGVPVYVVSASPLEIVLAAAARLGIAEDHVAAMTPEVGPDGVILPRLAGPIVYGEGKLTALERVRPGAGKALLAAFGDSPYDAHLLRAARVPVAVSPSPALAALVPGMVGAVVLPA